MSSDSVSRGLAETSFGYIHYRQAGEGAAVLLIHPNQQSSMVYSELIAGIGRHARAIAIDLPGHGGSDHISFQPTIEDYASCALEVMDALGIESFAAWGENTGAVVAVELAAKHPHRVTHAILVNCPFIQESPEQVLAPFKNDFRPADASGFPALRTIEFILEKDPKHSPVHPTQEWMDRMNRAQIEIGRDRWQALTALANYDLASSLPQVAAPVLLLTGEHFYQRERVPQIESRVADIRSRILVGGRVCVGWELASEIAEQTLAFVAERPRASVAVD